MGVLIAVHNPELIQFYKKKIQFSTFNKCKK